MARLIVIRLHPVEPVENGEDFARYLDGLTIQVFDLTTAEPLKGVPLGTAVYKAPADPRAPWLPHPQTTIVQHVSPPIVTPEGPEPPHVYAVATAVVAVPDPPHPGEHATRDLRLEITRAGRQIVHRQVYFNVPEAAYSGPTPVPVVLYPGFEPSLFLSLPAAALDGRSPLELPEDGTPPRFGDLLEAVRDVLGNDPGDTAGLPGLTPQQARHVAYEIVWNRALRPLPLPADGDWKGARSLETMYTGKKPDDNASEQARRRFEGDQQAYYARGNAEAERLAGFVHALGCAVAAQARSRSADRAGFTFPVLLAPPDPHTGARYRAATTLLAGVDALPEPGFAVPAGYFYVLAATMPTSVTAERRYELALLADESQTRDTLHAALSLGVLDEAAETAGIAFEPPFGEDTATIDQAARRLRALGAVGGPAATMPVTTVQDLVRSWLAYTGADIDAFWSSLSLAADRAAHLELVLTALTGGHGPLIAVIKAVPGVGGAADLAGWSAARWRALFGPPGGPVDETLLPPFLVGGTPQDKVNAFVRHVAKFFAVTEEGGDREHEDPEAPPRFRSLEQDPLTRFVLAYEASGDSEFVFGQPWDEERMRAAVIDALPGGAPEERRWLENLVRTVDELTLLAAAVPVTGKRFSVMEALYARGFTSREQVRTLSPAEFAEALTGTVAHDHAPQIHDGVRAEEPGGSGGGFRPVNPDGSLVDCLPPEHLSPLGQVAYLHQLLRLSTRSTCENPFPTGDFSTLGDVLAARRGPLGTLLATEANLSTPLPLTDLVNEALEAVASHPGDPAGAVHDTGRAPAPHDPAEWFAALPEHATPAVPVAEPGAYDVLRADFSAPALPYHQPLDIDRSYLRHLRTSRYATMRGFRRDITELALAPAAEPAGFQRHLWRYPVRFAVAIEYLGISPEEAAGLYGAEADDQPAPAPWELYGFPAERVGDAPWTQIAVRLPEFLTRTGLAYGDFLALWRSEAVPFEGEFPDCEPCDLTGLNIAFPEDVDPAEALWRLAVFIRLWRTLRTLSGGGYTLAELAAVCAAFGLFDAGRRADFLRQLAAFQLLRDDFGLALGTDDDPTALLALWSGPSAPLWAWAVDELLDQVQRHAQARHGCGCRPPEFLKLLAENLDRLSLLAGFDPAAPADTWHARPAHTLRFAEVLGKIYASDFGVGEILYLFTADHHLRGDDPFPLQPDNEALDSPLGLPDDEVPFSLWELRRALLAVDVTDEEAATWSWSRVSTVLHAEFGLCAQGGDDPLPTLGGHLFPSVLQAAGQLVPVGARQYRTALPLAKTAPLMWNTPPDGPFRYDTATEELWTALPLTDEAVIAKLARVRRLRPPEQDAVRELYFRPRADLAPFAFLFGNLADAEERLLQEPDEAARWAYFQRAVARTHARCRVIAEHLTGHVAQWTGRAGEGGHELAWALLRHLYADENRATGPWESDSGAPPEVTWPAQPSAGAFAALLGLAGTGLLGELTPEGGGEDGPTTGWREVRGPMSAFGPEENAANVQIPTILPSPGLTLTDAQERFVSVRNGFALATPDGRVLGGAQGYTARWSGVLLVEAEGSYEFRAGAPAPDGEPPDVAVARGKRWRVTLRRGQRSWVVLSNDWPDETAPAGCSAPLPLRRGAYELTVELTQPGPAFDSAADVHPLTGGFEVKYAGPDSAGALVTIPHHRLFRDRKDAPLDDGLGWQGAAQRFLRLHVTGTLRDIRRTYQRAFKALLLAHRFDLSARPVADDGQSEIGYLLAHAEDFAGTSYYRTSRARSGGTGFAVHRAYFDPNLLPVRDTYLTPTPAQDRRVRPTPRRRQALFDWWERLFDHTVVRRQAVAAPERPLWLLYHEAAENHPDDPAHLVRHMGVDLLHTRLVLTYGDGGPEYTVSSRDLQDERWAVRVWHADLWVRAVRRHFLVRDIRRARPASWAAGEPDNDNLTEFVREGCVDNGEPVRLADIRRLNDGLRERGRAALVAYLCGMGRVPTPDGSHVTSPRELGEVLLLDVEAGLCQRTTRVAEAIGAAQLLVRRAQLGLEPGFAVPPAFSRLWETRFATFGRWRAAAVREAYPENWLDWEELARARNSEAFRFLEAELRRSALTLAEPGGLEWWSEGPPVRPPAHTGLTALQAREPAGLRSLDPALRQGFDLLGTPERHARPSWLATARPPALSEPQGRAGPAGPGEPPAVAGRRDGEDGGEGDADLPLWIQTAVRLGTRFLRVAAACEPPAATGFTLPDTCRGEETAPRAVVDEYWFWLLDSRHFAAQEQQADWPWQQPDQLPGLLHWRAERGVLLAWCRVHLGQFQPPRRSAETVLVGTDADLDFVGRSGDSLTFRVSGGVEADAGFRYDLPTDAAVALPPPVPPPAPPEDGDTAETGVIGGLPAYPYFAYHTPGARLAPASPYAPAIAVAGVLRTHCRFEAALRWYDLVFTPLTADSAWHADDDTRRRAVILHYAETLAQWGEAALRCGTPESLTQARLLFDTVARLLGRRPRTVEATPPEQPPTVDDILPSPAPLNPRLPALHDRTADRLAMIHACLRRDQPEPCTPQSPYRFTFLVAKALELAGEVRALGTALLAAHEKGDAEYLASLRATHETQLLTLGVEIRQNQWRESDWQLQALHRTREMALTRHAYFSLLVQNGLIGKETEYQNLTGTATALRTASNVTEGIAQIMSLIPDMFVGFPCNQIQPPVGSKLGGVFSAAARITNGLAEITSSTAGLRLTQASWERREEEWRHQVEVLGIEIQQIERQILAAERRRDMGLAELNSHQRQLENSGEVQDFLRDRFTSHDLYLHLVQETAALHRRLYELALRTARQAQLAFNAEMGHTDRTFLPVESGGDLRENLQAGERLQLGLRQMEHAYLDGHVREYELTKHFSLRRDFPLQFLHLQATGVCEIDLAEWMFDLDYGHYLRRVRNVSLTIPCVTGPYSGVHCRLTLLSSSTRISPELTVPPACCCGRCPTGQPCADGYSALPDDPRIVNEHAGTEAIATSTGQADPGLFELDFRDERRLPFEFRGAVSRWRIELRPENNQFDLDTVTDLVLHLNYTAREGGDLLRRAAGEIARRHLPGGGWRYFEARHDMPDAWCGFRRERRLPLRLSRPMFPFLPGSGNVLVDRLALFVETAAATPGGHHRVTFVPTGCDAERVDVECVAGASWPSLLHGVLRLPEPHSPLPRHGETELGTLVFPDETELPQVTRLFLFCGYETGQMC